MDIEKKVKGRKFIALQEGVIFGSLYTISCVIKPELTQLMPMSMAILALVGAYLGSNVLKAKYTENKK